MPDALPDVPWTWIAIRATGIVAWGLLSAVVAWGLATRVLLRRARPAPRAVALHRWLGTLCVVLVLAHMGLLLVDPVVPFTAVQVLVPLAAPWEPWAVALGTLAFWALLPAWVVGRLRRRLGDRWFAIAHAFAYAAWPLATAHYVLAGTDALASWSIGLIVAGTALVVLGLLALAGSPAGPPGGSAGGSGGLPAADDPDRAPASSR